MINWQSVKNIFVGTFLRMKGGRTKKLKMKIRKLVQGINFEFLKRFYLYNSLDVMRQTEPTIIGAKLGLIRDPDSCRIKNM